jgi:O-antigen/teichoic acid export membrane protein
MATIGNPLRKRNSTRALLQTAGARVIIIALNAATGIVSARGLQLSGRGELATMILWNVLLANASTFGVPSALTYQLGRLPQRRPNLVAAALLIAVCTSGLAIGIALVGLDRWNAQYPPTVILFSKVFLWNTPVMAWSLIARAALESEGDFKTSNQSLLLAPCLTLLGLLVLAGTHHFSALSAAWMYMLGNVPPFFLLMARLLRRFEPSLHELASSSRLLMTYGIRSYGIDLCGTMSFYVDQVLVIRMLRPEMMGAYVVALSLSRMLNAFHVAVAVVLLPKLVSRPIEQILILTGRAVRLTSTLTMFCGFVVALLGPVLLEMLYGKEYARAAGVVRILVVEVVLSGVTLLLSQPFMALGRPGLLTIFQVLGLLLNLPLLLVFVPRFGVEGAALALLASTIVRLVAVCWSFRARLGVPCPSIFPKLKDFTLAKWLTTIAPRDPIT